MDGYSHCPRCGGPNLTAGFAHQHWCKYPEPQSEDYQMPAFEIGVGSISFSTAPSVEEQLGKILNKLDTIIDLLQEMK